MNKKNKAKNKQNISSVMEKTIDEEPDRFWNYNNGLGVKTPLSCL